MPKAQWPEVSESRNLGTCQIRRFHDWKRLVIQPITLSSKKACTWVRGKSITSISLLLLQRPQQKYRGTSVSVMTGICRMFMSSTFNSADYAWCKGRQSIKHPAVSSLRALVCWKAISNGKTHTEKCTPPPIFVLRYSEIIQKTQTFDEMYNTLHPLSNIHQENIKGLVVFSMFYPGEEGHLFLTSAVTPAAFLGSQDTSIISLYDAIQIAQLVSALSMLEHPPKKK